jgi:type IV pilus modification protein PilV
MTLSKQLTSRADYQGQQGFTLIEVLIAMVILGIGIFAIVALQAHNTVRNKSSKAQSEGYTWAMDEAEQLLVADYEGADLSVGTHTRAIPPYTINWNITAHPIDNAKQINMTILWNNNKQVATLDITRKKRTY